jgi:hypothetical protein
MKRFATWCLVLFVVSACGPAASPSTSSVPSVGPSSVPSVATPTLGPTSPPTSAATPTPAPTTVVRIYLFADEHLVAVQREIPYTLAVGRAALEQTILGPNQAETSATPRLFTSIPDGTRLLGLEIKDGLATINLSREFESGGGSLSMFTRLAQIVYALTQFPTVDRVALELDGQPVTVFSGEGIVIDKPQVRADYESFLPAIFIDGPGYGATLENPARVVGVANVFEATFLIEIRDATGAALAKRQVMASCGTGCWGTFDVTMPYSVGSSQPGSVVAYDLSPKDGTPENVTSYPVLLVP